MEETVVIESDELKLSGVIRLPDNLRPGERRPAFLSLHGFGSNNTSDSATVPARMLADWGYITLRFDFRGCGTSEGTRARLICLEQVSDIRNAVTFFAKRPEVDASRIGVVGSSFGAAVAIYAAGVDKRLAAVIASGSWGDGATKFRRQHASDEAWDRFTAMMERGREHKVKTGESIMVPRFDIVPIPEHLRSHLAQNSIMEFNFDTVESMYNFRAKDVVGKIAPRPLLLLHSSEDSVTPTEQSIDLFQHSKRPTDLHLVPDVDHFMFSQKNPRVITIIREWLEKYFPVAPA
jgi:dipeptidyl aminopeptidase/acylaminoacyl peptidase